MIKIRDLEFEYFDRDEEGNLTDMISAIRGIHFDVKKGDFIAVAGKNGSGKSTFAKILNRLLVAVDGTVLIGGMDAMQEENTLDIRKLVGMVFQNPDDQLFGSIVAEDVAFGAENIGVPEKELWERVLTAVNQAGLCLYKTDARDFAERRIQTLSGGEKQKVAIAGVLAMKPSCIVLDESTSMLDPRSRMEILRCMKELNSKLGIAIVMITHRMDELLWADTIYIMNQGRFVMKGRKEAIFSDQEKLISYGLSCPDIVKIKDSLLEKGVIRDAYLYSVDALAARIKKEHPYAFELGTTLQQPVEEHSGLDPVNAILINDLSFSYGKNEVLKHVSISVAKGEYVVVVGETGSGKSTLLQHIPCLMKPKPETIYVDGLDVADKTTDIQKLRCKIGYVFQYPEQQLFAKNVYEDVVFGPRNVGISEVEAEKRAYEAIRLVGLSSDIYDIPIQKLSGGQKRRVALAGVLAMKPEYLILDEPLAGLDPEGKENMLAIIDALHREAGMTIIMVSHDMESVAGHADRVIWLADHTVKNSGRPEYVFYRMAYDAVSDKQGKRQGIDQESDLTAIPVIMQLLVKLRLEGLPVDCMTVDIETGIADIVRCIHPYSS